MPNFHYNFVGGFPCAGPGPGAVLAGFPNPLPLAAAQLMNAQLRLGVYPPGWVADEMNWRIYAFCIGCMIVPGGAILAAPPAVGAAPAPVPVPVIGGVANLPPSPVANGVDATEKGQIGYHMGTVVGGALGPYLATIGPGGTLWFAFHLSRAQNYGGVFTFGGAGRPDIVLFAVNPATLNVYNWVVWENKGHCGNVGPAPLAQALAQAQMLQNVTVLPGGAPIVPPRVPDAHIASQVDVFHGNYRAQTIDPPMKSRPPFQLPKNRADDFFRAYYGFLLEGLGKKQIQKNNYDGRLFQTIELAKEVRLGLDNEIYQALALNKPGLSKVVAKATQGGYRNATPDTVYVDPTGISVELPKLWSSRLGSVGQGKTKYLLNR